ncbi:MAG: hypothetical protein ACI4XJ_01285 [Eubacteriales bacterium]
MGKKLDVPMMLIGVFGGVYSTELCALSRLSLISRTCSSQARFSTLRVCSVTQNAPFSIKNHSTKVNTLKLRLPRGDTVSLHLQLDSPAKYEKDDVVYKLSAFMYPVQCSWDEDGEIFCPNCGASSDRKHKKCPRCRTTLVPKEKW